MLDVTVLRLYKRKSAKGATRWLGVQDIDKNGQLFPLYIINLKDCILHAYYTVGKVHTELAVNDRRDIRKSE